MKKGFFSHQLCFQNEVLNKHVIYLSLANELDSVFPFQREISLTTFCEGILFVVDSQLFPTLESEFATSLQQQMAENENLSLGDAIITNSIYTRCQETIQTGAPCALYAITSIDWFTYRIRGKFSFERVV